MDIDERLLRPVQPEYGVASLGDLIPSALSALQVPSTSDVLGLTESLSGINKIAVLLVDGLGYHLYSQAAQSSPILASVWGGELGGLRRLTTNFPSTTPTSLTSLGTGVTPGRHGVLGFTVNVPGTDDVLTHILWGDKPDPLLWQPVPTCFERAAAHGVAAAIVSRIYPTGGLTAAAFRGGDPVGSDSAEETAAGVVRSLNASERSIVYGYYPLVDRMGHEYGVDTPQWHEAVAELDRLLRQVCRELPRDAALLVTADHGMLNIPESAKVFIDDHPQLRHDVRVIAGEPRARYIHVRPGKEEQVARTWRDTLGDRVEIWTRGEAITAGWFGDVSEDHRDRIGDLIVVCRGDCAIVGVTETDGPTTAALRGYHGAHSEIEMAVPLWLCRGGEVA